MRQVEFVHVFFFNDTATTEIYTLSLHDALPISSVWPDTRAPGTTMVYVPSSLLSAPSPMTGIATSTWPRGKPPSLVTFPVMVTGSWAGALATTSRASATAANTLRTMRRMMGPPGTAGNGRTASLSPRYEAVPGGAIEMRRAAGCVRRPPSGARRPAPIKPKPGAGAPGLADRGEWPSHSTHDLHFTLPSESALPR